MKTLLSRSHQSRGLHTIRQGDSPVGLRVQRHGGGHPPAQSQEDEETTKEASSEFRSPTETEGWGGEREELLHVGLLLLGREGGGPTGGQDGQGGVCLQKV